MKNNFISTFFSFFAAVDTADKHSFANISAIFEKNDPMAYSGARGTLIYDKKLEVENLVSDSL